ncbi:MAG: DNA alkylation repair protein [Chloroflexi bacterium]|nr:DNA alkylation repair protein [Chloroflexota bacterium]
MTDVTQLRAQLLACADADYQAGSQRVGPTQQQVWGVRMPDIKRIARDWQQHHKQIDGDALLAVTEALWAGESRDERLLSLALLERYKKRIGDLLAWEHFENWRVDIDNWIVCDYLGTKILPPWMLAKPDQRLRYLDLLIVDEDVWSRRLSLVTTVPMNRDKRFAIPEHTFILIDQVKHERDPMITKAISWALRELTKTSPALVATYISANQNELSAHILREVNNKLTTGLKSG